jgi:hypothetical protein
MAQLRPGGTFAWGVAAIKSSTKKGTEEPWSTGLFSSSFLLLMRARSVSLMQLVDIIRVIGET